MPPTYGNLSPRWPLLNKSNPRSPDLLAITRILVYFGILITYFFLFRGNFSAWISFIPIEAWLPVGILRVLPAELVPFLKMPSVALALSFGFVTSTICCIAGYKWKYFKWTTLLLTLFLFGLRNSFGHSFRSELVLVLAQFVLVFAPANHAISVDSSLTGSTNLKSQDYDWPISALRLLWVSIFFFGGLSKVRNSGFSWVTDNYLGEYLLANQITRAGVLADRTLSELGPLLASMPTVTFLIGLFVFVFELLYPLILVPKFRKLFLAGTIIFQVGVFFLLGVNFFFYLPLLPIWSDRRAESAAIRLQTLLPIFRRLR